MMSSPPSLATTWVSDAGRLDHHDLGLGAVVGDGEVLGPHAVDSRAAVGAARRRRQRQAHAARPFEAAAPFAAIVPFRKFMAGEPMKPATNMLRGRS